MGRVELGWVAWVWLRKVWLDEGVFVWFGSGWVGLVWFGLPSH